MITNQAKLLTIGIGTYQRPFWIYHNLRLLCYEIDSASLEEFIQIIVINDDPGSALEIQKIIKGFRRPYIFDLYNDTNLGLPQNLSNLILCSKSEYTYLLSDDDFLIPGALSAIISVINDKKNDMIYLNYQAVNSTADKSVLKMEKARSIIAPRLKLNRTIYTRNISDALFILFSFGFFQTRLLLSQQSVVIFRTRIIQENLKMALKVPKIAVKSLLYPHSTYIWHNFPKKCCVISSQLVNLTVNNATWNSDIQEANKTVRGSFNILLIEILKKYYSKSWIVVPYVLVSLMYSYMTYFLILLSKYFMIGKVLVKIR